MSGHSLTPRLRLCTVTPLDHIGKTPSLLQGVRIALRSRAALEKSSYIHSRIRRAPALVIALGARGHGVSYRYFERSNVAPRAREGQHIPSRIAGTQKASLSPRKPTTNSVPESFRAFADQFFEQLVAASMIARIMSRSMQLLILQTHVRLAVEHGSGRKKLAGAFPQQGDHHRAPPRFGCRPYSAKANRNSAPGASMAHPHSIGVCIATTPSTSEARQKFVRMRARMVHRSARFTVVRDTREFWCGNSSPNAEPSKV